MPVPSTNFWRHHDEFGRPMYNEIVPTPEEGGWDDPEDLQKFYCYGRPETTLKSEEARSKGYPRLPKGHYPAGYIARNFPH
jgi:hypothetical protein